MENLQINLACRKCWIYVAVIVIIIALGGTFGCTCKPQQFDCNLHMTLPSFIIFIFVLWTDSSFQRVCRHLISSCRGDCGHTCSFLGSSLRYIIRAAFISLLWAVYVLLDGKWYVCCMNDHSEQQAQLPCKSVGRLTNEERVIVTELQNMSRTVGSVLLFAVISVPALLSTCEWRKPSSSERKHLYYKLILEQQESVLKDKLRKYARERLNDEVENKIRADRWEECFNVAEELISVAATPKISEQQ